MNSQAEILQLAQELGTALLSRGWRVSCAESCTGGGVAQAITEVAGSSGWFDMAWVTYSNAAKQQLLGVHATSLEAHGAVSEPVAREMAQGALLRAQADLAVAISGIAGPGGGSETKPVGTVCFAWASPTACHSETLLLAGDRHTIRQQAVMHALRGLLQACRPE